MKKNRLILSIMTLLIIQSFFAQTPSYVPTNGLVAYWPFNGNANDESGNGNNGSVIGSVSLTPDRIGNINSAFSFPGNSNSYINCGNKTSLKIVGALSLSAWIYMDGGFYNPRILQYGNGAVTGGYAAFVDGTSNTNRVLQATNYNVGGAGTGFCCGPTQGVSINALQWHHFTYTSDSNGLAKLYIDGIIVSTFQGVSVTNLASSDLNIGRNPFSAFDAWGGKIDDIGIWNRVLNQQEITNLFNSSNSNECLTMTINTGVLNTNPITYTSTINIYPNPANDQITINCGNLNNVTGWNIKIIDILGQEVFNAPMNTEQYEISLNTLSGKGMYFVKIINAQNEVLNIKKIILK
jgi:hypothetical protein